MYSFTGSRHPALNSKTEPSDSWILSASSIPIYQHEQDAYLGRCLLLPVEHFRDPAGSGQAMSKLHVLPLATEVGVIERVHTGARTVCTNG